MPDLIIKPTNTSGNKLILQDQAGGAVLTTADSGATLANTTLASTTTFPTGCVLQIKYVENKTMSTSTTTFPVDDTIPQNTEGVELMTLEITPKSTRNKLLFNASIHAANNVAHSWLLVALFQGTTANAIASGYSQISGQANGISNVELQYQMTAATTSATTFKIRAGGNANTTTFNGSNGARLNGGVLISSMTITEIQG